IGKPVPTEFAATFPRGTRNPWDVTRTPGGSSSGSAAAVAVGIISAGIGTQVIGSIVRPSGYCGCYGFKPTVGAVNRGGSYDGLSQSVHGTIAATLEECWAVTWEIAQRAGGDPGYPGLYGPQKLPVAKRPRRLAFIETAGWETASAGAKAAMNDALARLGSAGVEVVTRKTDKALDAVEVDIMQANQVSRAINAWEGRWPLNTYAARDASQLSGPSRERLAQAEAMTLDQFRGLLATREKSRALHARLAGEVDACISLTAPAAAPVGLDWTGDPACTVHTSYLGIPSITLPVMWDAGMPLG